MNRPSKRGKGSGLAFIIHQDVHHLVHNLTSTDVHLEQQAIKLIKDGSNITIVNIYCPPASSCSSDYELSWSHLLHLDNTITVGDFNAHHHLWHSALAGDTRGNQVAQKVKKNQALSSSTITSPQESPHERPAILISRWSPRDSTGE